MGGGDKNFISLRSSKSSPKVKRDMAIFPSLRRNTQYLKIIHDECISAEFTGDLYSIGLQTFLRAVDRD